MLSIIFGELSQHDGAYRLHGRDEQSHKYEGHHSKLPFKTRKWWRVQAFDLQELRKRRARFADVNFVDRQAKIISDPLIGDLNAATAEKKDTKKFQQGIKAKKGSSFATNIELIGDKQSRLSRPKTDATLFNCAFMKQCVFCGKNHTLEDCQRIREQPHKESVEFLKKNGFCIGCLVKGHLSRDCKRRMTREICSQHHLSMLHKVAKERKSENEVEGTINETNTACASATLHQETNACTGAGGNSVLAIVPFRVKFKKSNKTVEAYAFMDPGSSASFCTEALAKQLKVQG